MRAALASCSWCANGLVSNLAIRQQTLPCIAAPLCRAVVCALTSQHPHTPPRTHTWWFLASCAPQPKAKATKRAADEGGQEEPASGKAKKKKHARAMPDDDQENEAGAAAEEEEEEKPAKKRKKDKQRHKAAAEDEEEPSSSGGMLAGSTSWRCMLLWWPPGALNLPAPICVLTSAVWWRSLW